MDYNIIYFILSSYFLYMYIYWTTSCICYLLDRLSLHNKKISNYKIQKVKINFDKYHDTIKTVYINQIKSFPFIFLMYPFISYIGNDISYTIPSIYIICKYFITTLFVFDILFYIGHIIGHKFYMNIHRHHHKWKSPVGVAAHYSHIYEHIILNVIVPSFSTIIVKSNAFVMLLWILVSTYYVVCSHSGYSFLGASKHDTHHKLYKYNFGIFISDHIFNTYHK